MKTVSFDEYQKAKAEIIGGVEYKESTNQSDNGNWGKTYATEKNGTFYEVYDPISGLTEFYSTKHSESRYYDGRTREELIEQVATLKKKTIITAPKLADLQ